MLLQKRMKVVLVTGALLALAAALVALLVSDQSNAAPEAAAGEQFSVLKPVTQERMNALPEQARATLGMVASAPMPGNDEPEEISEVGVAKLPSGAEFAVAALGEAVCAVQSQDSACLDKRQASAGDLFGARPRGCGDYWVFGVVPDGVSQVGVDSGGDGEVDQTLPVASNVYEGTLDADATVITGLDADGNALFETEVPLDYYEADNPAC